MKDFYDYLDEIEDDDNLRKSREEKYRKLEKEQEELRREELLKTIYDGSNNSNNYNARFEEAYGDERLRRDIEREHIKYPSRSRQRNHEQPSDDFESFDERKHAKNKKFKKHHKKKAGFLKKLLWFIVIIVLIMLAVMFWKYKYLDADTSVNVETSSSTGISYTNIALFGLDSREGEMESGVRSDSIIIASINNFSHKINMVSVLRDTFVDIGDGDYAKINAAFSKGGAKQATETLNKNLDLDIKNYMVINFEALIKAVDAVGGIDLDMEGEEVFWLNGYQLETAKTCGMENEVFDLELRSGIQHLNGVQATAFCRVRYIGTDVARANRQRIVLQALIDKVKRNPFKLNNMIDEMFPHISTNMSYPTFARLGLFAPFYSFDKSDGFPYERRPGDRVSGYAGSYVVADDMQANVKKLHKSLFGDSSELSPKTQEICNNITYITSN